MARGKLYVFEGPDGVGKTTLGTALVSHLRAEGRDVLFLASPGREDGTLGKLVWELHHDCERFGVDGVDPTSLQLLHVAAHIDTLERRIIPALGTGQAVVMDRFWWSTLVYGTEQGAVRGSLESMIELERRHWGELSPDVVFLVTRRRPFRDELSQARFERLAEAYRGLASATPSTVLIENSGSVAAALRRICQYTVSHTFTSK